MRPPVNTGPTTSPMLPPVPCNEMANPRLSGNLRESDAIAGGWYSDGPIPTSSITANSTQ